jgi:hypothetical protein
MIGTWKKRDKAKDMGLTRHTACFNITTGDVEDAPAPNALNKFEVFEKNGGVYIHAREEDVKAGQRNPVVNCKVSQPEEKVVVIGG